MSQAHLSRAVAPPSRQAKIN